MVSEELRYRRLAFGGESKERVVMSRVAIVAVAGALSLHAIGAPVGALAADMPGNLPPAYERPLPPPRAFDFNTGWYVRGDLGYNWTRIQGAQSASSFPSPTDSKLNGAAMAGVGAGIKTQWARTDLTIDYSLPMKYQGSVLTPNDTTAKITAASVMFNGYLDLGTWYGVTPYLGGGGGGVGGGEGEG
jgi:opacity protein-like surface antigen